MILQRILLVLALIIIVVPTLSVLANILHRSPDDIDIRPENQRPRFPTK